MYQGYDWRAKKHFIGDLIKIILWKIPSDDEITSAENVNLDLLINQGCDWAHNYLEHNPNVSENDKHLSENINPNYS